MAIILIASEQDCVQYEPSKIHPYSAVILKYSSSFARVINNNIMNRKVLIFIRIFCSDAALTFHSILSSTMPD
jgi:hypothetical protein